MIVRLAVVFLGLSALSACKPIKEAINEAVNAGKLDGVSTCKELSASDLLSEETIIKTCVTRFEDDLPPWARRKLDGRGRLGGTSANAVFSGSITNGSGEFVVTQLVIEVLVRETKDGPSIPYTSSFSGWFEPGSQNQVFSTEEFANPPEDWGAIPGCGEKAEGRCWSWAIKSAKGLKI